MSAVPRSLVFAKHPRQDRAISRFEHVLKAADALLRAEGLAGFSIPKLAETLGYSRASIYKFFPTPYAVLNELARRYLEQLEQVLTAEAAQVLNQPWDQATATIVGLAAGFYERHPVARILILGGPLTDDSYRAQELTIQRLGKLAKALLARQGIALPEGSPDVATLAVEIGTTCFRLSHFVHGRITPEYRAEAAHAMIGYLSRYARTKTRTTRRAT